jgi:hypothetical protein
MTPMPDAQTFKQVIDCVGYSFMGLVGLFGAWQRVRVFSGHGASQSVQDKRGSTEAMPIERLERIEQDIAALRARQTEINDERILQQNASLKQQAAMFDLLVQQRSALDKILAKMGGLT